MKSAFIIALLATLGVGVFNSNHPPYEEREAIILDGVMKIIEEMHVNPKPIDDDFSKAVFKMYLDRIDGSRRFLMAEEVAELSKSELIIDDQINARNLDFFDQSLIVLEASVERARTIFDEIKGEKLDFTLDDYIELDYDKKEYKSGIEGLKEQWRNYFKYDVLANYVLEKDLYENDLKNWDKADAEKRKEMKKPEKKTEADFLNKAKNDAIEDTEEFFKRMSKLRRADRFETYLSAITNYHDPHTSYYNPKEKEDFDMNMGGSFEGIGARLSPDGDFTKVTEIILGGPAHEGKELEKDDLIIAVAQDGEEPLDIVGMRLDDVVQKIRGKKGTKVILTVKKVDGAIKNIEIIRNKVIVDESFARSFILDVPDVLDNIGYIKLPKFYSQFGQKDNRSCAVDVAKELKKLKAENVNGVILDLRNNTGGSLNDVVEMTGLFYEEGPVVQVKPRKRKAYIHKDKDSDVVYDGPLIVMVNENSASASEILAAALQDYGRAIIVGSQSTFGKGSVQRFIDLDRAFSGIEDLKPLGNLKISLQKFYRVNGGSTQLKGVQSDIVLPDSYHYIDRGEKEYDNALIWDEIEKKDYSQSVVQLNHLEDIRRNSNARVENSENFKLVLENAKRLKENRDFTKFPLNMKKYEQLLDDREEEGKKFDKLFKDKVENLSVKNLEVDLPEIQSEEKLIERNNNWLKGLGKDFYLEETLYIMKDMIQLEEDYTALEAKMIKNKKIRP